ncbi:MAG: hypothetical protein FJ267_20050, partial [Planctomycetes bacterium]|nr:hypothetical protein [Planctomycetota bacterium]
MRFPKLSTATLFVISCCGFLSAAQERQLPYDAIVETEGEYVRSGPGPTFYPTDRLKKGNKITVHRHDPGGWCMIAPPTGSFSWIRAEYIEKTGKDRGVLKKNNVVVHVGSNVNPDEYTTIQGNLSKGDAVEILGEKMFLFEGVSKQMYKITPIKKEWRWITRKAIVPADSLRDDPFSTQPPARKPKPSGPVADRDELDPNSFAKPISTGPVPVRSGDDAIEEQPITRPAKKPSVKSDSPAKTEKSDSSEFRSQLDEIDRDFRAMIQQDPSAWQLDDITKRYQELEDHVTQPAHSNILSLRRE